MVGWNFKSELVFYEVPGNTNGKMSQEVYINSILYPHVLPEVKKGKPFVLEEDGDSGHGSADNNNIVRRWKANHRLQFYFNAPKSPDLSIIENCWQPVKQFIDSVPHWDEEAVKKAIIEGWRTKVSQDFINERVRHFPDRLHDVLDHHGKLTGY